MGSFFRNQTFPENWHRRAIAGGGDIVAEYIEAIYSIHPTVVPGENNAEGVYVPDGVSLSVCPHPRL